MVGDRETIAARCREQVLGRHAEVAENNAAVVRVLERPQTVLAELKVLILFRRQFDNQHGRLAFDEADQPNRTAGHDVGDEQLLAIDDVFVAFEPSRSCAVRSDRCRRTAR